MTGFQRLRYEDFALPSRERGMSPETFASLRARRELHGGYFYPLDASRALDMSTGEAYGARAVKTALADPESARNVSAQRQKAMRAALQREHERERAKGLRR